MADTLAPELVLERLYGNIGSVLSTVSTVGVVIGGAGLVTASFLQTRPGLALGALASSTLAACSVAVALWATTTRMSSVATGNLVEVEDWYDKEIRRGKSAALAGWLLFGAVALAGLTALIGGLTITSAAVSGTDPTNRVIVDVASGDAGVTVHLGGAVTGLDRGEHVRVTLEEGAPASDYPLVVAHPDEKGTVNFDATTTVTGAGRLSVLVTILAGDNEVDTFTVGLAP